MPHVDDVACAPPAIAQFRRRRTSAPGGRHCFSPITLGTWPRDSEAPRANRRASLSRPMSNLTIGEVVPMQEASSDEQPGRERASRQAPRTHLRAQRAQNPSLRMTGGKAAAEGDEANEDRQLNVAIRGGGVEISTFHQPTVVLWFDALAAVLLLWAAA
eukprot:CAMPEP_0179996156 /NCGR_PEP_ID=MMETSP0984-20121128/7459_1 /TAXON_ID=483367 /ORGANISM="non described non described, Strain CCMP 2436" /LENGTH=158 /DNA_ID=CAMNT_0021915677 /DNA_START=216 /DNA_END=691 /DNA_ORIENTATION=-